MSTALCRFIITVNLQLESESRLFIRFVFIHYGIVELNNIQLDTMSTLYLEKKSIQTMEEDLCKEISHILRKRIDVRLHSSILNCTQRCLAAEVIIKELDDLLLEKYQLLKAVKNLEKMSEADDSD